MVSRIGLPQSVADGETCVWVENVELRYRLPEEATKSFKHHIIRWVRRSLRYRDFVALRGVTFSVKQSEVFGVVGSNGAGKTSLLQVISRILRPTRGRVIVRGRVAPLFGLGAGFHPDLTGIENIFLNGSVLGLTREQLESKVAEIEDFAEIGDFINSPLRVYSQGMRARLAFSTAAAIRPDVLLLDEVMTVGDEAFRNKCIAKIREFCQGRTTVIIVSHALAMMRDLCDRVAWIEQGQIVELGDPRSVIDHYEAFQKDVKRRPVLREIR